MESKGRRVCFAADSLVNWRSPRWTRTAHHVPRVHNVSKEFVKPGHWKKETVEDKEGSVWTVSASIGLEVYVLCFSSTKKSIETFEMRKISCGNSQMLDWNWTQLETSNVTTFGCHVMWAFLPRPHLTPCCPWSTFTRKDGDHALLSEASLNSENFPVRAD